MTPWIAARQASLPITNSWSSLRLTSIESFPRSQLFTWGGQSTGVSALVSFLPKKSQGWSRSWLFILFVYLCFLIGVCKHAKSFQSCPTHCNPMDCSPWGSSLHGILQARILERVVMPSSRGSSWIPGGLNSALLHCSEILYHLSHQGSPFNWYVFFFFDNFIYDCSGLHCLWAFSSCREWGLLFSCSSRASHCGSFSCCRNGL